IQNDALTIRTVSPERLDKFRALGLGGNAQFVNCNWILELPLIPLKNVFDISRGERRGKNALFYPKGEHEIEAEYLKPLAKSSKEFRRLSMSPTKVAFACSRSEEELITLGHSGAVYLIREFRPLENIAKLSNPGRHWYEMNTESLADLVLFINYGDRLFVGRVDPPSFADQRLIPLKPKE